MSTPEWGTTPNLAVPRDRGTGRRNVYRPFDLNGGRAHAGSA